MKSSNIKKMHLNKIYLFGAGGAAGWVLQGFIREGIRVEGFLDDAAGETTKIGCLPVFTPNDPFLSKDTRETAIVVLCVMNPIVD